MTQIDDPSDMPKKGSSRKKLVDLKAVAAILRDEEPNNLHPIKKQIFTPNEELIQDTTRVKSQRDLVESRIAKMESSQEKVSKNVFEKVRRDYNMQLDNVNRLLGEKKALLMRELKNLYMLREKTTMEVQRHKDILEEARFRHHLDEFSEEQFQEVEEFETREINNLQSDLAQIHSYIKVHEELFDPKDLGLTHSQPTRTVVRPQEIEEEKPKKEITHAPAPKKIDESLSEKTPAQGIISPELEGETESLVDTGTENYFEADQLEPVESKSSQEIIEKTEDADSILDIIENQDDLPQPSPPKSTQLMEPSTPTPPPTATGLPETGSYKLVFTESENDGPLEYQEVSLKDNISIGRSPSNDIILKAPKISRQHAAINKYKDQYILIDLKSSNGAYVNGKKIDEHALEEGDEISLGGYKMLFKKV